MPVYYEKVVSGTPPRIPKRQHAIPGATFSAKKRPKTEYPEQRVASRGRPGRDPASQTVRAPIFRDFGPISGGFWTDFGLILDRFSMEFGRICDVFSVGIRLARNSTFFRHLSLFPVSTSRPATNPGEPAIVQEIKLCSNLCLFYNLS